ncbi:formin-like protein 4 [Cucurbita pepo subsp. pepo]|uniref:formin-like protein 4 n=1 Tax=Cucurbita pepo subsp. pepo TaxID=3664 RepID=UPI000C9D4D13|nr:formin-like protein 4 [Cucurbita pepo subsp. pepo]
MAVSLSPWLFLPHSILFLISIIPLSSAHSSPQNNQASYPFPLPFHFPTINNTTHNLSISGRRPPPHPPLQEPKRMTKGTIIAVAVSTVAATLLLSLGLLFYIRRRILAKLKEHQVESQEFTRLEGKLNGLIVEEDGLDVMYWKKNNEEDEEMGFARDGSSTIPQIVQQTPLLHQISSIKVRDRSLSSSRVLPLLPRLFTKLLEATLKVGNRLNSGTTRGNAKAFHLNLLLRLSDVKSTHRKFIVKEVIKFEGKKQFSNTNSKNLKSKKEIEIEYIILGLSAMESLTLELSNVKKASTIDYETFTITCPNLLSKISEIQNLLSIEGGGEYKRKMLEFVKSATEEVEIARREQKRVLDELKKTNEYYETGDRENSLGIFVIVKNFVNAVNQVCREIVGELRGKIKMGNMDACLPLKSTISLRFPRLAEHFKCRRCPADSMD